MLLLCAIGGSRGGVSGRGEYVGDPFAGVAGRFTPGKVSTRLGVSAGAGGAVVRVSSPERGGGGDWCLWSLRCAGAFAVAYRGVRAVRSAHQTYTECNTRCYTSYVV